MEYFNRQLLGYTLEALQSSLINQMIYWGFLLICIVGTGKFEVLYIQIMIFIAIFCEVISIFTLYDIPLLIKFDKKFNKIVNKKVVLEKLERERVVDGKHLTSRIGSFFSRKLGVNRYKLYYVSDERFGSVRLLLGYRSRDRLKSYIIDAVDHEKLVFNIKYLKYSKVLYHIMPCENSKFKKEQQELINSVFVLEKPIGLLNGFKSAKNRK